MPVDSTHPEYDKAAPFWQRMRDVIAGEDAIKEAGSAYLPVPPSVDRTKGEHSPEYKNYKARARFPEAVAPAIEGMVGLMSREGADIELPRQMEYLREEATPDGLTLEDLYNRVRHEVVGLGRYILLVDVREEGGDPYIATYPAEVMRNWRAAGDKLTMAVFYEQVSEPKDNDPFEDDLIDQWREATIVNGVYTVRVWRRREGTERADFYVLSETVPTRQGAPLNFVPAVVIGSRDLSPAPDSIPLLGVANKCLHYYKQYADYALQLFMSANGTTPYALGFDESEDQDGANAPPSEIGPNTIWTSSRTDAKVGFIEISGSGLDRQEASLDKIADEIATSAMKALGDNRRQAESGEALRLRFQSQTANLASIARTTGAGMELALTYATQWAGFDVDQVRVTPKTEFIRDEADPQVLTALADIVDRGFAPEDTLFNYLRRTKLTEMSIDELRQFTPRAQALEPGDDG